MKAGFYCLNSGKIKIHQTLKKSINISPQKQENSKKIILQFPFFASLRLRGEKWLFVFLMISVFTSCDVARQARKAQNLSNCDFRIVSVENVNLSGIDFQHVKSISDISFMDAAIILAGFTSPTFPLSLQLTIEGRNPNQEEAGLERIEWVLFVDDFHMTSGILDKPFVIPARGASMIPVQVAIDLKQVLSGKSAEAVMKFCMNLAGMGKEPTRFKIKLKPTIMVAGSALKYPGFITVNTTYQFK
jgi:LEA14-like dessication related protein